jgi:HlyD family secretion protein
VVAYTTQPATRGDLTLTVTANGTIQPTRSINIGSELSGTVLKVNVDVNDQIKKGQVLVVLDTAKLPTRSCARRPRWPRPMPRWRRRRRRSRRRAATGRLEEWRAVGRQGAVEDRARHRPRHAGPRAGRRRQRPRRRQDAKAALSTDQINLSKASISAPADGVVLTRTVDPGNAVAASLQAVTLFTVAEDLSKLRLWVYVDEADVGAVKVGQDATFTVSAYPTAIFRRASPASASARPSPTTSSPT